MTQLVVNNRITAGKLRSNQYLTDAIAYAQLTEYRNRGMMTNVRCSKHDWIAMIVTQDERSTVAFADGFTNEADAAAAAREALSLLSAN